MSYTFDGVDQWIGATNQTTVIAYPFTILARAKPNSLASQIGVGGVFDNGAGNDDPKFDSATIRLNTDGDVLATQITGGAPPFIGTATSSGSGSSGAYCSLAGVFRSDTDRSAYRNGANVGNNATDVIQLIEDCVLGIGLAVDEGDIPFQFFDGDIFDFALYSVALTAREIAAHGAGFCARRIRPQSLRRWIPLIRNLQEVKFRTALTNYNGAVVAARSGRLIW